MNESKDHLSNININKTWFMIQPFKYLYIFGKTMHIIK